MPYRQKHPYIMQLLYVLKYIVTRGWKKRGGA